MPKKQLLTHRKIIATFWELQADNDFVLNNSEYLKIERKNLKNFAFPKVIDLYLQEKVLTLF